MKLCTHICILLYMWRPELVVEKDKYRLYCFLGCSQTGAIVEGKLSPGAAAVLTTLSVHTCLSPPFTPFISPFVFLPFVSLHCLHVSVCHFTAAAPKTSRTVGYAGYLFGYFHFKIYAKLYDVWSNEQTMRH